MCCSLVETSGLPDPLFRIRPEPDPDFFLNQYPAGTGSGSFFQTKIRPEPEPDPDPKYFKLYVVSLKKELIKFNYYNTF